MRRLLMVQRHVGRIGARAQRVGRSHELVHLGGKLAVGRRDRRCALLERGDVGHQRCKRRFVALTERAQRGVLLAEFAQAALQLDELIAVLRLKHVQYRVAACRLCRQQRLGSRRFEACGHLLVSGEVRLGLRAQLIEEGA